MKRVAWPAGIFLLLIILYWPVLRSRQYVYDDHWFIERNPAVGHFSPLRYFYDPTTAAIPASGLSSDVYRPLTTLSWAIDHALGFSARAARFENVLLHFIAGMLVWLLLSRLFGPTVGLIGCFVFLFHPVQTQSVAWLSQRSTLLSAVFGLGSLVLATGSKSVARSIIVYELLVLALFTKESAVVFLPFWILIWRAQSKDSWTLSQKRLVTVSMIVPLGYFFMRWTLLGHFSQVPDQSQNIFKSVAMGLMALPVYAGKCLVPIALRASYDTPAMTVGRVMGGALIAMILTLAGIWGWKFRRPEGLLAAWILIGLMPFLQIIPLRAFVIERALYLPIIGAGAIAGILWEKHEQLRAIMGVWAVMLLVITLRAVPAWTSDQALWEVTTRAEPTNAFAHASFAESSRDPVVVRREYEAALANQPSEAIAFAALNNLAVLSIQEHRGQDAVKYSEAALKIHPDHPQALYNAWRAYTLSGDQRKAKEFYERLERDPRVPPALLRLHR
jgi:hypothetical protein